MTNSFFFLREFVSCGNPLWRHFLVLSPQILLFLRYQQFCTSFNRETAATHQEIPIWFNFFFAFELREFVVLSRFEPGVHKHTNEGSGKATRASPLEKKRWHSEIRLWERRRSRKGDLEIEKKFTGTKINLTRKHLRYSKEQVLLLAISKNLKSMLLFFFRETRM